MNSAAASRSHTAMSIPPDNPALENCDTGSALEADLCIHIFTASAALVGVCLTVIGLIRIVVATTKIGTIADALLAGDATLFMIACLLSYWALRARNVRRMHRIERLADAIFLLGLLLMTAVCGVVTWEIL